jgi:hypothetical protein
VNRTSAFWALELAVTAATGEQLACASGEGSDKVRVDG